MRWTLDFALAVGVARMCVNKMLYFYSKYLFWNISRLILTQLLRSFSLTIVVKKTNVSHIFHGYSFTSQDVERIHRWPALMAAANEEIMLRKQMFPRLICGPRNICCGSKICFPVRKKVSYFFQKQFCFLSKCSLVCAPRKQSVDQTRQLFFQWPPCMLTTIRREVWDRERKMSLRLRGQEAKHALGSSAVQA